MEATPSGRLIGPVPTESRDAHPQRQLRPPRRDPAHGKQDPAGPSGARQGLNDYTGWFAGDDALAGDWLGYDGPFPPPNDLRPHRYFFRLFALDLERLDVPDRFTAADVQRAMHGHVLAEALVQGHYSLHPARPLPAL